MINAPSSLPLQGAHAVSNSSNRSRISKRRSLNTCVMNRFKQSQQLPGQGRMCWPWSCWFCQLCRHQHGIQLPVKLGASVRLINRYLTAVHCPMLLAVNKALLGKAWPATGFKTQTLQLSCLGWPRIDSACHHHQGWCPRAHPRKSNQVGTARTLLHGICGYNFLFVNIPFILSCNRIGSPIEGQLFRGAKKTNEHKHKSKTHN